MLWFGQPALRLAEPYSSHARKFVNVTDGDQSGMSALDVLLFTISYERG